MLQQLISALQPCRWPAVFLAIVLTTTTTYGQTENRLATKADSKTVESLLNYTEATTLGVAHLDIDAIDAMAIVEYARKLFGDDLPNEPQVKQGAIAVDGFLASLRQAGANDLLLTISTEDLMRMTPAVIAPTENPAMLNGMLAMPWMPLQQRYPATIRTDNGIAVFGANHTVERLRSNESANRFDQLLAEPSFQHQLMLALPDESRQDLEQLWPEQMPAQSPIQFSPRQLVKDLESVRIAWSLPPTPQFSATFKAIDVEAAERVRGLVDNALRLGGDATKGTSVSMDGAVVTVAAPADVIVANVSKSLLRIRGAARKSQRSNDFKQLVLAMHNYFAVHKELPGPIVSETGQALHSFRVRLLPYLNQNQLFNTIKTDQPWDAAANQMASGTVIPVFAGFSSGDQSKTSMQIPVIEGSLWSDPKTPKHLRSITDGSSNTIAYAEAPASAATPWMKPGFWELDEDNLIESFFGDRDGTHVAFFDGSVIFLSRNIDPKVLRALLTHAGGEVIDRNNLK